MATSRVQQRWLVWFAAIVVLGGLLYLLSPILTPFAFAAILAYIFNPLVNWLEQQKIPRTLATVLIMLLMLVVVASLVLIILPLIQKELGLLKERLPDYIAYFNNKFVPWLSKTFDVELQFDIATLKQTLSDHWQSLHGIASKLWTSLGMGGAAIIGWLINLLLIPVVLFYLLRDWNRIVKKIDEIIPRHGHRHIVNIVKEIDRVLAEFLRGQLSVMLLMSIYYTLGLWLVGLEFALPIGIITGTLVFIPYLGTVIGLILATAMAFIQFPNIASVAPVWIVLVIGQLLEGLLVTPWLVGDRIGLHPVAVIFALLAFGQLFGFVGVLLALPASAALLVGLRHLNASYKQSSFYQS